MALAEIFIIIVIVAIIVIAGNKQNNTDKTGSQDPANLVYVDKTDVFDESELTKYTWIGFSIKEVSFPEEPIRYYAVATITGYKLGYDCANVIIRKLGDSSTYDLNPHFNHGSWRSASYECCCTYDRVIKGLESYFKSKKLHDEKDTQYAIKDNYYYTSERIRLYKQDP